MYIKFFGAFKYILALFTIKYNIFRQSKENDSFLYSTLARTKVENNVILRVNKLSK